ncbi:hypothetical protein AB834_01740 [PVC group bacterium (ex Bugula neritina AB1)]|nr:hypothetical protein AB834_01740 [PVC group bacterium (ex Bugula neritina AB1)]
MQNFKPDVSIIIINYNSAKLLEECLRSIDASKTSYTHEILIVDNDSKDSSYSFAKNRPDTAWVQNPKNYGFAKACNKGARHASGNILIFVNVDTHFLPDSLDQLVSFMTTNENIGACGPRFVNQRGISQNSVARYPSFVNIFFNKRLLQIFFPKKYINKHRKYSEPLDVQSLIGACFCIRKDIFKQLKGFDEAYFFYMEETDLCWRLHNRGYRIVYLSNISVLHHLGQSAKKKPLASRIEYHKGLYLFLKKKGYSEAFLKRIKKLLCIRYAIDILINGLISKKAKTYWGLLFWHLQKCPSYKGLSFYLESETKQSKRCDSWAFNSNSSLPKALLQRIETDIIDGTLYSGKTLKKGTSRSEEMIQKDFFHEGKTYPLLFQVKKFQTLRQKILSLFIKTQAFKSWKMAHTLKAHDLPTLDPLMLAEKKDSSLIEKTIFITKYLPKAQKTETYLNDFANKSLSQKRQEIKAFADFIGHLHNKGFHLNNFKLKNMIVDTLDDSTQFYISDLYKVNFTKKISLRKVILCFSRIYLELFHNVSLTEKLYFLKKYSDKRPFFHFYWKTYFKNIPRIATLMSSGKTPWRNIYIIKNNLIKRKLHGACLIPYTKHFSQLYNLIRSTDYMSTKNILKQTKKYRIFHQRGLNGPICCKQLKSRSIKHMGSLHREWLKTVHLYSIGICTPRPIAYLYREKVLLMKYISHSFDAADFFYNKTQSDKEKKQFVISLATFVGDLHSHNIFHTDLTSENLLLQPSSQNKSKFFLIDTADVLINKPLSKKHILKNIAQILSSFPKTYSSALNNLFFHSYQKANPSMSETLLIYQKELYAQKNFLLKKQNYLEPIGKKI